MVTGFFDKNTSGTVDEGEKIFTHQARDHRRGHGAGPDQRLRLLRRLPLAAVVSIASGMLIGSMMSSLFMPSYVPMYSQPYTTPPGAAPAALRTQRAQSSARPKRPAAPRLAKRRARAATLRRFVGAAPVAAAHASASAREPPAPPRRCAWPREDRRAPVCERDPLELLNLHVDRDEPDPDYTGFGYGRLALVHLAERERGRRIDVCDALVVALHSAEEARSSPTTSSWSSARRGRGRVRR